MTDRSRQDNLVDEEENQRRAAGLRGVAPEEAAEAGPTGAGENSATGTPEGAGMSNPANLQPDVDREEFRERSM